MQGKVVSTGMMDVAPSAAFWQRMLVYQRLTPRFQVAITGAASGIGRATAQLLASQGALLSISDRDEAGLKATMESLSGSKTAGPSHLATQVDVTSASDVDAWIASTVKHFGHLDCAANIAGIHLMRSIPVRDSTDDEWTQVMDINATGVFFCLRAQL